MRIDIMTLFPETLGDVLSESILGRAQERGFISIDTHQIRDYTSNKQNQPIGISSDSLSTSRRTRSESDTILSFVKSRNLL